eukprot:Hpha_TRINITY_DN16559_c2_g2::TRINITY_DN16559_c2_g2_i2::g.134381::m.134381
MVGLSGKQKRKLLRDKRSEKAQVFSEDRPAPEGSELRIVSDIGEARPVAAVASANVLPESGKPTTVRSLFVKETAEEVEERKMLAMQPMRNRFVETQGVSWERWYSVDRPSDGQVPTLPSAFPVPTRPEWSAVDTKDTLERRERLMFRKWLKSVWATGQGDLNTFELNLDVWRQLWRVVETSDVVLLVADARHPHFHVPPALVRLVREDRRKPLMVVLNKCDLIPASALADWKEYFAAVWPGVPVCEFSCRPNPETATGEVQADQWRRKKGRQRKMRSDVKSHGPEPESDDDIQEAFLGEAELRRAERKENVADQGEIWMKECTAKVLKTARELFHASGGKEGELLTLGMVGHPNVGKSSLINALKGELLTLGMVGHPNVGKSSLINALKG